MNMAWIKNWNYFSAGLKWQQCISDYYCSFQSQCKHWNKYFGALSVIFLLSQSAISFSHFSVLLREKAFYFLLFQNKSPSLVWPHKSITSCLKKHKVSIKKYWAIVAVFARCAFLGPTFQWESIFLPTPSMEMINILKKSWCGEKKDRCWKNTPVGILCNTERMALLEEMKQMWPEIIGKKIFF